MRFERIIRDAQERICKAVTELDGTEFHEDAWTREDGGGGISRVLQNGKVFEKAGVNVSVVYGSMPAAAYRCAVRICGVAAVLAAESVIRSRVALQCVDSRRAIDSMPAAVNSRYWQPSGAVGDVRSFSV